MVQRKLSIGAVSVLAALGIAAGTGAASAQTTTTPAKPAKGAHVHTAPVQGVIQSIGASSLVLQTQSGTVTVPFTSSTRVIQQVAGQLSDLTPNTRVELKLNPGTTTATALTISPAPAAGTTPRPAGTGVHKTHTPKTGKGTSGSTTGTSGTTTGATGTTPPKKWNGVRSHAGGQVVSFSNGTLVLKGRGTQTASYTLAPNATITKVTVGTTGVLHQGETIVVFAPAGGAARIIEVIKG